jgi:hypothetical protein
VRAFEVELFKQRTPLVVGPLREVCAVEAEEIEHDVGHADGSVAVEHAPAQRREVRLLSSPSHELAVEYKASRKALQFWNQRPISHPRRERTRIVFSVEITARKPSYFGS